MMEETKRLLHELIEETHDLRGDVGKIKSDRRRDRKIIIVLAVVSIVSVIALALGTRAFFLSRNEARERAYAGCTILNNGIARDEKNVQAILTASAQSTSRTLTEEEQAQQAKGIKIYVEGQGMSYNPETGQVHAPRINCDEYVQHPNEVLSKLAD